MSNQRWVFKTFSVAYSLTVSRCLVTTLRIFTIVLLNVLLFRALEVSFGSKIKQKSAASALKRSLLSRC